ncbi:MAG: pilus assembly protein [Betaproteobacteria bacterium]|nr:pilus assembly protein [Betaproteobacteria bacterium]
MRKSRKPVLSLVAAAIAATALAVAPGTADAAGLGKLTVLSAMGQPLRAEVDLTATREEISSMVARMASAEAFKQAGVEFNPALAGVKVGVATRPDGRPVLQVSSDRPFNEPFVDLLVELSWASGRLLREYTFLLDPPDTAVPKTSTTPVAPPAAAGAAQPAARTPAAPAVAATPAAPAAAAAAGGLVMGANADIDEATRARALAQVEQRGGTGSPSAAARPAPQAPRTATGAPADKGAAVTRQVRRGDTLGAIAEEVRPAEVSLDQMLVSLFRANRDAFDGNNMNRLKAGKILTIPAGEQAGSVGQADAHRVVVAQTRDFSAYRRKLAASVAAAKAPQEAPARQAAVGKIAPRVDDKAPAAADAKDQLKVSRAELGKEGASGEKAGQQARITSLEEELVAKEKALKEATSRLSDVERNVNELQKLVEMKNQALAELQKQADAKKAPAAEIPAAPVVAAPEPLKPAEAPAPKPAEPSAEKPAEPAVPTATAEAPKQEPAVQPPPPPASIPEPADEEAAEPSMLDALMDNPMALVGGGGIVALILGYLGFRFSRRRKEQEAPITTMSSVAGSAPLLTSGSQSMFTSTAGETVDTTAGSIQTDINATISSIDADEGVDPVAEADVYMAYGRDAQAEEILLDALKNDPTRHAIYSKLLEIYAQRKDTRQFESFASELYAQTGGVGSDWEKAAALGRRIDPANPLYGGEAVETVEEAGPSATSRISDSLKGFGLGAAAAGAAAAEKIRDTWTMPGELSKVASGDESPAAGVDATVVVQARGEGQLGAEAGRSTLTGAAESVREALRDGEPLDFDLGFDTGEPKPPTEAASAEFRGDEGAKAEEHLDFDVPELTREEPSVSRPVTPEATDVVDLDLSETTLDLEMMASQNLVDLEATDFGAAAESARRASTAGSPAHGLPDSERTDVGANLLDFGFDLGEQVRGTAETPRVDLSDINLDLEEAPAVAAPATPGPEEQEATTKIELALAYEEMGDKEGARELLQEVIKDGNRVQQDRARSLLGKIG